MVCVCVCVVCSLCVCLMCVVCVCVYGVCVYGVCSLCVHSGVLPSCGHQLLLSVVTGGLAAPSGHRWHRGPLGARLKGTFQSARPRPVLGRLFNIPESSMTTCFLLSISRPATSAALYRTSLNCYISLRTPRDGESVLSEESVEEA